MKTDKTDKITEVMEQNGLGYGNFISLADYEGCKKAMQEHTDQAIAEYKLKLEEAFTKADFEDVLLLSDYIKILHETQP